MTLMQIRYLLTVADAGSITRAAQQLYISQPGLSKQLALLEKELGTELISRGARGVTLTEAGKSFAEDCRRILSELDDAVRKVSSAGEKKQKVFRIGCFDGAVIEDFMPALYKDLREKGLDVRLTRSSLRENRENLKAGRIDLLIELQFPGVPLPDFFADCESHVLVRRKGALIYSVRSPLAQIEHPTPEDFAKEPFLMPSAQNDLHLANHSIATLKAIGINHPIIEETGNLISITTNLSMGHGYSIMARDAADYNPDLIALELPEDCGLSVVAIWKKSNDLACSSMRS